MEIIIEISPTDADKLHINGSKLSFDELRRKIALSELSEALDKTQSAAKTYGLDTLSMDEINNLIKEANADYNAKGSDFKYEDVQITSDFIRGK